jgi:hypothetical protein
VSGLDALSSKALFTNNVGILNTSNLGHYFMINNTTDTTVGGGNSGVWLKAQGITTVGDNNSPRWIHTTNRTTYTGNVTSDFVVTVTASVRSASNNQIVSIGIAKNGTIIDDSETVIRLPQSNQDFGASSQTVVEMSTGDYVELFVKNNISTADVRVSNMSLIINKIPA